MTVRTPLPTDIRVSERPWKVRNKNYKDRTGVALPFIAWDGEGYTDDNGVHHYNLFGAATIINGETVVLGQISGPSLGVHECFDLLLKVKAEHEGIHVIFAGGYDMVMMIHKWPTHKCERILKGHPTHYEGYRVEYFKSKYLKLSNGTTSIVLYDVFTYFACSFVKACREYLPANPIFDDIERTKALRNTFTEKDMETLVVPYWKTELRFLCELMQILRKRMLDAGIRCTQWHGPGAVAGAILKQKGIKAHMGVLNDNIKEASRHAYYGGRFEQFRIGYDQRRVYRYDIRSAYPAAIARLPSLASSKWRHTQRRKNRFHPYGLYRVDYHSSPDIGLLAPGPLPWRDWDKAIYYPHDITNSWYWGIELTAAKKHTNCTITVHEAWEMVEEPYDYPFRWIAEMYEERAKMKREGNPTQLALKLGMNSIYGKLAQSKGARLRDGEWQLPAYHQLEWAGWITAATRAILYEAMTQAGSDLIAVETDSVFSLKPLNLKCSTDLGDWELEEFDGILYIQSGVYFIREELKEWKIKSRGFSPIGHTFEHWYSVMEQLPTHSDITVKQVQRRFGTLPRSENFAKWYELIRESRVVGEFSKRIHDPEECFFCANGHTFAEFAHQLVIPQHLIGSADTPSRPHKLPWIDDGQRYIPWNDEWVITVDGIAFDWSDMNGAI